MHLTINALNLEPAPNWRAGGTLCESPQCASGWRTAAEEGAQVFIFIESQRVSAMFDFESCLECAKVHSTSSTSNVLKDMYRRHVCYKSNVGRHFKCPTSNTRMLVAVLN